MSLSETILQNLLTEREMCKAKLVFVQTRLDMLEAQIAELKQKPPCKMCVAPNVDCADCGCAV